MSNHIQAQRDAMTLAADKALTLNRVNGEITLNAAEGITLVSRGAYIKLKDGSIEIGAPGDVRIKNDNIAWGGAASLEKALTPMVLQDPVYKFPRSANYQVNDPDHKVPRAHRPYRIETSDGHVLRGVTDENGDTQVHHGLDTQTSGLFFE